MCDCLENICTFWGNQLDWAARSVDTPILTAGIASPRHGEDGWREYDAREIAADHADLTPEECRDFSNQAYSRLHWETAKLVGLVAGTVVGTIALVAALELLVIVIVKVTVELFALLFTLPLVAETPLGVLVVLSGLTAVAFEVANAFPAFFWLAWSFWQKEAGPHLMRSHEYMTHLQTRARVLEIQALNDPAPVAEGA